MKITKTIAEKIAENYTCKKFNKKNEELENALLHTADKMYFSFFKGKEEYLESLQPGWFVLSSTMIVPFEKIATGHNVEYATVKMTTQRRMFLSRYLYFENGLCEESYSHDFKNTCIEYLDLIKQRDAQVERRRLFKNDIKTFILQFTTINRLIEQMPDLEESVPPILKTKNTPAIVCNDIALKYPEIGIRCSA